MTTNRLHSSSSSEKLLANIFLLHTRTFLPRSKLPVATYCNLLKEFTNSVHCVPNWSSFTIFWILYRCKCLGETAAYDNRHTL